MHLWTLDVNIAIESEANQIQIYAEVYVDSGATRNISSTSTVSTKRKRKCTPLNKHKDPISNSKWFVLQL